MTEELVPFNAFANLSTADVTLPRLQLVQPTSSSIPEGNLHVGEWWNSVTGQFFKSFQAVIIGARAIRVKFPKVYAPDNAIDCSSPDAIRPAEEFVGKLIGGTNIPELCKDCPFSQWTEDADEDGKPKRVRPACDAGYLYAGIMADEKSMPFSLNLRGSGMAEAKRLNFTLMTYGVRVIVEIGSQQKSGQRGNYSTPSIKVVSMTPPELIAKAVPLSKAYAKAADDFRTTEPLDGGDVTGSIGQAASAPAVDATEPEPPEEEGFIFGHVQYGDDSIPF